MSSKRPLLVLMGPTAVGKTASAIKLCQTFNAQVVGADSVQVYRGLDIGSAKPTEQELAQAPHHLVDVIDPSETIDAAKYVELADKAISQIHSQGKNAVVAGGTGLYIKALLHGLMPAPKVDHKLREKLKNKWDNEGKEAMHALLAQLDPTAAKKIHPADRQRVVRALEVCYQTGRPFSDRLKEHGFKKTRYEHLLVGLKRPKEELFKRIEQRCHLMWEQGLVEEVQGLIDQGVSPTARCLQSLGYRQVVSMLHGDLTNEEALRLTIKDTKAYAKRQLTWLKGMKDIHFFAPYDLEGICRLASKIWDEKQDQNTHQG